MINDDDSFEDTVELDHYQTEFECENFNATQPLYNGAKVTVLEAIAQFFEWFTDHPATSKQALSNMLHMQHNSILPEGNLLPDSYASAR